MGEDEIKETENKDGAVRRWAVYVVVDLKVKMLKGTAESEK